LVNKSFFKTFFLVRIQIKQGLLSVALSMLHTTQWMEITYIKLNHIHEIFGYVRLEIIGHPFWQCSIHFNFYLQKSEQVLI